MAVASWLCRLVPSATRSRPWHIERGLVDGSGKAPWLSVVTVSLKDDDALWGTIDSVERQGVAGVEQVVVLGAKPTPALLERMTRRGGTVIEQAPHGIYAAMNEGWSSASGTYVHFLNAGDTYAGEGVVALARHALKEDEFDWCFGRMIVTDPVGGREHVRGVTLERMRRRRYRGLNFPELPTVLVRRSLLHEVGGFDTSYRMLPTTN